MNNKKDKFELNVNEIDLDSFEPVFVSGIVNNPAIIPAVSPFLTKTDEIFKNRDLATLTKIYKVFFEKYNKIPTKDEISILSLKPETKDSVRNGLNAIKDIDYASFDNDLFMRAAERFLKERHIWRAMVATADELDHKTANSSKILNRFEDICSISLDNDGGLDLYKDIDNVIISLSEKQPVISTGYPSIDKHIDGGLYKDGRALYMFMAPPNKGKSLFLGNIACNLADNGLTALVISLEMSELAYAKRFCAQQAAIPFAELALRTEEVSRKLKSRPGKIIIKEFPPSSITVAQLRGWIKNNIVNKGTKIDAIIIDYLNLFDGSGEGLYEKIKDITEQVRALSYWFKVPVISATQQNRQADGKSAAGLNSVSESSGISMTTDVLLELYQTDEDAELNYFRLGFAKNRYGPNNFSVITKVDFETLRITDADMVDDTYTASLDSSMESSLVDLL